jgi:hypothetical protein
MSQLFLDTETRWFLPSVASELLRAGYSREEEERIWRREALPHFGGNLLQVAGEWASLTVDEAALVRRAEQEPRLRARILSAISGSACTAQWRGVQALRASLESRPEALRAGFVGAWNLFARAYLDLPAEGSREDAERTAMLRSGGLGRATCEQSFADDFRPVYRRLLLRAERSTESARAHAVTALIERAFPSK